MRVALRLAAALFCWTTAVYAFLCASAFSYQQFIRPRVFHWVGAFSDHHAALYWVFLSLALASIPGDLPDFGSLWRSPRISLCRSPFRAAWSALATAFAVVWGAVGVLLTIHPVLPTLAGDTRSVVVGLIALLPLVWLGVIDHARSARASATAWANTAEVPADALPCTEGRLFAAFAGTAVVVPLMYAGVTALALSGAFEPDLLTLGTTLGLLWNAADHLLLFCGGFLAAALFNRLTARAPFAIRYAAAVALVTFALAWGAQHLFADAIGLNGIGGAGAAILLALSIVATWCGLRIHSAVFIGGAAPSGFDAIFAGGRSAGARWRDAGALVAIAAAAFALNATTSRLDWDFMLAKLAVIAIWVAVFDRLYRASAMRSVRHAVVASVCVLPLLLHAIDTPVQRLLEARLPVSGLNVRHTLDRYVVYNPSFRLTDGLVRDATTDAPPFDRFLRANTGVAATASRPVDVDFVKPIGRSAEKPWIFLFVIDSLRADYLGAYNPHVTFTPAIDRFARESTVFTRAFTRYGGTGLSMPAIWMGAAGVHTQYLQPFRPMDALEKLLDANAYARHISLDHIMGELLTRSPALQELDRGVPEMSFDFCRTLGEIEDRVAAADSPIFAHSRSLNLHVAAIRASAAPDGEHYPGFEPRYASRVHRMDRCFGSFVDFLERRGIYDRSIVILTADHGEELGADGRWGHAYYLFPGVLQVPLLVHLPTRIAAETTVDPDAVAFTTDITPTLYAALGYRPARTSPLMGEPLIGLTDSELAARRRSGEVVIASYGAVYGALTLNGRRLYIADGNHGTEYAYERGAAAWREMAVSAAVRAVGQRLIREYIERIALEYHVVAP